MEFMQMLIYCGISMYYVKANSWVLVNETRGIAYGMVSYLKLAKLKWKKTTIQMNGWFNTRYDLIAWDSEDRKERLRGTKQGWRASDGLAAEEPS